MNGVRRARVLIGFVMAGLLCAGSGGCGGRGVVNPSFDVTGDEARVAIREMQADKTPFARPVVVIAGYMDPGSGCTSVAKVFRRMTPEPGQVVPVPMFSVATFDAARERVIEAVGKQFGYTGGGLTTEVDVVGISMGGLIARYAALPGGSEGGTSLRIGTLYTVSTPWKGAAMADLPTLDQRVVDMRAGSAFLKRLDEEAPAEPYEVVAYVRLGDEIVGAENAVPPSGEVWWVENEPLEPAHLQVQHDVRILADIARRLRGEEGFAKGPATALPGERFTTEDTEGHGEGEE